MEMIRWEGMEGGKGIDTMMVMRGEKGDGRWRGDEKGGREGKEIDGGGGGDSRGMIRRWIRCWRE